MAGDGDGSVVLEGWKAVWKAVWEAVWEERCGWFCVM